MARVRRNPNRVFEGRRRCERGDWSERVWQRWPWIPNDAEEMGERLKQVLCAEQRMVRFLWPTLFGRRRSHSFACVSPCHNRHVIFGCHFQKNEVTNMLSLFLFQTSHIFFYFVLYMLPSLWYHAKFLQMESVKSQAFFVLIIFFYSYDNNNNNNITFIILCYWFFVSLIYPIFIQYWLFLKEGYRKR